MCVGGNSEVTSLRRGIRNSAATLGRTDRYRRGRVSAATSLAEERGSTLLTSVMLDCCYTLTASDNAS